MYDVCLVVGVRVWIEAREPPQGPDGEHVSVASVGDGTGLVEHTLDALLWIG